MCKEMQIIPVNRAAVDKKIIIGKKHGGGEAQGVADTSPPPKKKNVL
jgi:hypothetical protein